MKKIQYNGSSKILDGIATKINWLIDQVGTKIDASEKGVANGVATLDGGGKVPSSQLPSYVDDVIEGYYYNDNFYEDSEHTQLITPETSKIYVDLPTNRSYRWGGSEYVEISSGAVQSDWNESDPSQLDYIRNKPTIPTIPTVATGSVFGALSFDGTDKIVKLTADAQGSGKDLNDYKTEGFYYFDSNNIPTNIPTGNVNGFLAVIKSGSVVKQFWIRHGSENTQSNTYVRLFIPSSSTWTTWRRYATTDDIPIVTDEKVKQTAISASSNANYRLLLSKSASNTEETDGVQKSGSLYYNPYDDKVTVQNVDISNTANIATAKVTSLITSQYYFNLGSGSAVAMLEANSASTTSNPTFVTLPASSGTLALQSELPTNPVLWSEYNVLGAKNLIPYPWSASGMSSMYNHGITFTYDEEGYVTLNGTADATNQPYMCFTLATDAAAKQGNELIIESGKKYTLNIDRTDNRLFALVYIRNTSGASVNVATKATYEDGTVRELTTDFISLLYNSVFHQSVTFEILTSGSYRLQVDLRVNNNSGSYTNAKGRVMLRYGEIVDDTWEKYAKSNYELTTQKAEVEDLEKAYTDEYNLLHQLYYDQIQNKRDYRGVTWQINKNSVRVSGTATGGNSTYIFRSWQDGFMINKNETYHLEGCPSGGSLTSYYLSVQFVNSVGATLGYAYDIGEGIDFILPTETAAIGIIMTIKQNYAISGTLTIVPKLIVSRKFPSSEVAPIENGDTASQAYGIGDYMIWKGGFYKVTSAISASGAISGKVTATTLSAEIKAIRDALNI